jgi:hypothetical protein
LLGDSSALPLTRYNPKVNAVPNPQLGKPLLPTPRGGDAAALLLDVRECPFYFHSLTGFSFYCLITSATKSEARGKAMVYAISLPFTGNDQQIICAEHLELSKAATNN